MTTQQLLNEAISLPVDLRVKFIDDVTQSLFPKDKKIEEAWNKEIQRRVENYKAGNVKSIPGETVFKKVEEKFNFSK